jgi:aryl-alcohol dehydrogenase-like predicted oxidoreductase
VLYVASSNIDAEQLAERERLAAQPGRARFCATQLEWNLLKRGAEAELVPAARRAGQGIVPYFPLASGMLTGKYRRNEPFPEGSRLTGWRAPERFVSDANFDTVERLTALATERGHTILELAMSWLAAQEGVASVIAGATNAAQVAANVAAAGWALRADDLAAIDALTA